MYQNYSKITADEELGAIDFIGDYLLHGKDLFGHNSHDKTAAKGCDVQFQHQASPPNVVFSQIYQILFLTLISFLPQPAFDTVFYVSNYQDSLFRPPLT